jgi:hypothetical protein
MFKLEKIDPVMLVIERMMPNAAVSLYGNQ